MICVRRNDAVVVVRCDDGRGYHWWVTGQWWMQPAMHAPWQVLDAAAVPDEVRLIAALERAA